MLILAGWREMPQGSEHRLSRWYCVVLTLALVVEVARLRWASARPRHVVDAYWVWGELSIDYVIYNTLTTFEDPKMTQKSVLF